MMNFKNVGVAIALYGLLGGAGTARGADAPEPTGPAVLGGALTAPAALAQNSNITHLKNLEYPNTFATSEKNAGTDLEFATVGGVPYAFAGSYGDGLQVIDLSDPRDPKLVATKSCGVSQGDVQVFTRRRGRRPEGGGRGRERPRRGGKRTYVAYAHDDRYAYDRYSFGTDTACATEATALGFNPSQEPEGFDPILGGNQGSGTFVFDVTDVQDIRTVSYVQIPQGSHNITMHPGGRYLYNSNSDLMTSALPAIEVFDLADFAKPVKVAEVALKTLPGLGTESHDISFNTAGTRAYSAALSHVAVLDTTKPEAPVNIGTIVDPAINVFHQSDPIKISHPVLGTRDFLVVADEFAGATGTGQCPNGGVHVYDITRQLELAPAKVGYWNIADAGPTSNGVAGGCTAHVFNLHEGSNIMTIAYFNGGVRVVDLTNLVGAAVGALPAGVPGMRQLGSFRFDNSDTWAVKAPQSKVSRDGFVLYGNDHSRGFDAYEYKPGGATAAGEWLNPAQTVARMTRLRQSGIELDGFCLLGDRLK